MKYNQLVWVSILLNRLLITAISLLGYVSPNKSRFLTLEQSLNIHNADFPQEESWKRANYS